MTRSVPQRWCAPAAAPALILLLGGAALAEPVQITVLHTNDVYEIAPQQGRGGLAELATLLQRQRAAAAHHHHVRRRSDRPRCCPASPRARR